MSTIKTFITNMKIRSSVCLSILISLVNFGLSFSQTYEVLNYSLNGTPTNGVKIKTNIPFSNGSHMVNLRIEGYSYGRQSALGINLVWYVYSGDFVGASVSSWGNDTPSISLANEAGKVVVFIHDKVYYQRFKVTAFAKGMTETSTWFQGWTAIDQALSGSQITLLSYKNTFGDVYANGNVGIGTTNPQAKLAVNGSILATEVKVKTNIDVPDYVFEPDYQLQTLAEIEAFVKEHKHLPEIPSAADIQRDGLDLAEMNLLLLKKVEELTLHLIEKEDQLNQQANQIADQRREFEEFKKMIQNMLTDK